jgi:hypothetical protein
MTFIFAAAALVSVMTAMALLSSNRASKADQQWGTASQITAQANLLRQKILECAAQSQDNATGVHKAYPIGSATAASALTCPVTGAAVGTWANIFTGLDGVFLPPAPTGFGAWTYTNDATSVRLALAASGASTSYSMAIAAAAKQFGNQTAGDPAFASTSSNFQLTLAN